MPASYRGAAIFGYAVKMATSSHPRRTQSNTYPGLDGVEELDMGNNGRMSIAVGRLIADTPAALAAIVGVWESYDDGLSGVLIDTDGTPWINVKLETFEVAQGSAKYFNGLGYTRTYVARFRHLT